MSLAAIFLIAAIILFILSAIGIASRVNLLALGLACIAAALPLGAL
jgi:hypothetical protein